MYYGVHKVTEVEITLDRCFGRHHRRAERLLYSNMLVARRKVTWLAVCDS